MALCGFGGNLQTLHPLNFLSHVVEAYIAVIVGGVMWPSAMLECNIPYTMAALLHGYVKLVSDDKSEQLKLL